MALQQRFNDAGDLQRATILRRARRLRSRAPAVTFSIRRLLLIPAAYGGLLVAFAEAGIPGIVAALISASALSVIVLVVRWKDALPIMRMIACTLPGAVLLSPVVAILISMCGFYPPLDARSPVYFIASVCGGALLGGILGAFWNAQNRKRRNRDRTYDD
jgi:hypothetical protein